MFDDLLYMDGYDDCVIGTIERFGLDSPIVCYDKDKVIQKLMDGDMFYEDALEFFEYNQIGAWLGERTPCFITKV